MREEYEHYVSQVQGLTCRYLKTLVETGRVLQVGEPKKTMPPGRLVAVITKNAKELRRLEQEAKGMKPPKLLREAHDIFLWALSHNVAFYKLLCTPNIAPEIGIKTATRELTETTKNINACNAEIMRIGALINGN